MIYLIGFMGSGKSTIAQQLSAELGRPYIEMDHEIEEKEQMKISDLFSRFGEAYFREKETDFLKNIQSDSIVSTGGGVILSEENQRLLSEGMVIYLQASWDTIVDRLTGDTERPLWQGDVSAKKARFEERLSIYERIAHEVICVDDKPPQVITEEIIGRLK